MGRKLKIGNITIRWHDRNRQWVKSVGYKWNTERTKLVQADFYLGADADQAVIRAAAKIRDWREIKADWPRVSIVMSAHFPGIGTSKPFWPIVDAVRVEETKITARRNDRFITLEKSRDAYIAFHANRIGLGAIGIKQSTLNTIRTQITASLATFPDKLHIDRIDHARIETAIQLYYREHKNERTALNYARALKQFLNWLESRQDYNWRLPHGVKNLFRLRSHEPDPVIPTISQLKSLFAACAENPRTRLYLLLGINAGMYEVDIATLTAGARTTIGGDDCLWWQRSKTSHQNAFRTLHWLFPETSSLLTSESAEKNRHGVLLLNRNGDPLQVFRDGARTGTVADAFNRIRDKAGVTGITFKTLRKFTATHLIVSTGKDHLSRLFLGQKLQGSLRSYIRYRKEDFTELTDCLKSLHEKLLTADVLQV